ncbi:lipoprotein insertase outer membrane protein LolB [Avibacterium sp. 20-126]|uniref:lipoprotein insertase outer membrane protein LolB n=1 Tax=Avibacterium sp. 20-126 TaxID=2911524 RepID=UPI00218896D2|nr:lipoprotein insertase outer membrane protein LolB [Avibacterium sp. 20-126]
MNSLKTLFIPLIISLLLAGCALDIDENRPTNVQYIEKNDRTWQQHLQQIQQIQAYHAEGQIGYISTKQRFSTTFDWQYQTPTAYTLVLSSALSRAKLTFKMHTQGLTISDEKGNQRSAKDAQRLLREIIGMDIPLTQLATWLKGEPNNQQDYNVGTNHLLANFTYRINDEQWTVDYLNYHQERSPALPRDILLKNAQQTLKIRVNHWKY